MTLLDLVDDLDCGWRLLACFCTRFHFFCLGGSSYMLMEDIDAYFFFLIGCSNTSFIAAKKNKIKKKLRSNLQLMKPSSCPRIGSV